jgi:hypothetical protein
MSVNTKLVCPRPKSPPMLIWADIMNWINNIQPQQLRLSGVNGDVNDIVTLRWRAPSNSIEKSGEWGVRSEDLGIQWDEEWSIVKNCHTILLILLKVSLHSFPGYCVLLHQNSQPVHKLDTQKIGLSMQQMCHFFPFVATPPLGQTHFGI